MAYEVGGVNGEPLISGSRQQAHDQLGGVLSRG